ncbi:MAG: 1,4-beta-xylanase [Lentisphaeria bacterium]
MNPETPQAAAKSDRWSAERANAWYDAQPWLLGCNFIPSCAINQLEMWQPETFAPAVLDRELGWAAELGMNSVRVFLHDLLWTQDAPGFLDRLDQFLAIADKHGIGAMLVFFDSCWHPFPRLGRQPEPEPGVHNSGWVQSPGLAVIRDPARFAALEPYITGVVSRFRADRRVQVWDLWNEPENPNANSYAPRDLGERKAAVVRPLLEHVFAWARAARPTQPLTSCVWNGDFSMPLSPLATMQTQLSDVISYHSYDALPALRIRTEQLRQFNRPLLCTEYLSRPTGSTFHAVLPYLKAERIAAYNWGLVAGKTQTNFPWDSWQNPSPPEPPLWFHDIFRADGTPYLPVEIQFLKSLTARQG